MGAREGSGFPGQGVQRVWCQNKFTPCGLKGQSWGLGASEEEESRLGRASVRFLGRKYSGALHWFSPAVSWKRGWKSGGNP